MRNEKAIELLEKIIRSERCEVRKDHPFPNEPLIHNRPCHRCSAKDDCFVIEAIEALALLQKQPPEGEFAKRLRNNVATTDVDGIWVDKLHWPSIKADILEACDRLDHAKGRLLIIQANKKKLLRKNDQQAEEIERLKATIEQLGWEMDGLKAIIQNTEGKIVIKEQAQKGGTEKKGNEK